MVLIKQYCTYIGGGGWLEGGGRACYCLDLVDGRTVIFMTWTMQSLLEYTTIAALLYCITHPKT